MVSKFLKVHSLIFLWPCLFFVALHWLSLVSASGGFFSAMYGFSLLSQAVGVWDSVFTASGLQNLGSVIVAPHVESPRTKDQTCLLCMVRWILTHCATALGLWCFLNSTLLRCGPCKHTDPSLLDEFLCCKQLCDHHPGQVPGHSQHPDDSSGSLPFGAPHKSLLF